MVTRTPGNAQNSLHLPATGLTPFQCVLSYQPPLFPWSGETICQSLLLGERESLGQAPLPSADGSASTKNPGQCWVDQHSTIPTWAEGMVIHPGNQDALTLQEAFPCKYPVPDTLVPFPSSARSIRSPIMPWWSHDALLSQMIQAPSSFGLCLHPRLNANHTYLGPHL